MIRAVGWRDAQARVFPQQCLAFPPVTRCASRRVRLASCVSVGIIRLPHGAARAELLSWLGDSPYCRAVLVAHGAGTSRFSYAQPVRRSVTVSRSKAFVADRAA